MPDLAKMPVLRALPPRWRKRVVWAVVVIVVYAIVGFLILPPIVRAVAVSQISKQLDRQVSIKSVRLNPFVLSGTVRGLLIKDKDGQPFISWDEAYANFQLVSFLGHPWVFKEVRAVRPFIRAQVNKDYTLNCSDLIAKFSSNSPSAKSEKPLALRVDRIEISDATASLADLTQSQPFLTVIGPLDLKVLNFRTDPKSENPYSFVGTTDAGETFSWTGDFGLDPLSSKGNISVEGFSLKKYAPLYQDMVHFRIVDGLADVSSDYRFELDGSNLVAAVTNAALHLRSFKLAEPGSDANVVELADFSVAGAALDATSRRAEVASMTGSGASLFLRRNQDNTINVLEMAKPAEGTNRAAGGVEFLLSAVTNVVAALLSTTNLWTATIHNVGFQNCALRLEDLVNSRPVGLELDQIALAATNISNLPGTNLDASISMRWNTNGTINGSLRAAMSPISADVRFALNQLELKALDPYLESQFNLLILGAKLSADGHVVLRETGKPLPEVTFQGNGRMDDVTTVDGVTGDDLLKWGSVRVSGIDASLTPLGVSIGEIAVDDLHARVAIETNHTINVLTALRMSDTNKPAPAPAPPPPQEKAGRKSASPFASVTAALEDSTPASGLPNISIASVVVSNAQIQYADYSLSPNVAMSIDHADGTITGISSEELRHAQVKMHARVDGVGPADITGTINPLRKEKTNDLLIVVRNVDLTPTSPYVGKFAGYRLARGKMELDLEYHVIGRQVKAQNKIVLDRFTFGEKVNSPDATKLPVRLAIAILKDRDGKIVLDVPVDGSLDDPDFRIHKVVERALLNLLTKIATSPFSVLGAVFGGRGDDISFLDFAAGSAALQPASKQKLDDLLKGLYARPALQVEIDGSVDPDVDRDGLREAELDKRLRQQKWKSLRKSQRATMTADQVTLVPEERPRAVKKLYAEALSNGEIRPSNSATNGQAQTPGAAPAELPPLFRTVEKPNGSSLLMKQAPEEAAPASPAAAPAKPGQIVVNDPIERALLDSMVVKDDDYRRLASDRAKATRQYLLQSGQVEADRIILAESSSATVKSDGSRVYFQLQ